MAEISGNIWDWLSKSVIAVTTNGHVTPDGKVALGRGCPRQAQEHFPDLACCLGSLLSEKGNHVHCLAEGIVSFPVEETPGPLPT